MQLFCYSEFWTVASLFMLVFRVMKKYILRIILFFILVALVDKSIGAVLDYFRDNARGGYNKELNYVFNQVQPDILILGSSRALHHYVPDILEDSLKMSCYNAGSNACSIIPMYCRFRNVVERYTPKIIIYEVYSETDYFVNDITRNEEDVRLYYDNDAIRKVYNDVKPNDKLKMVSSLYRYNSKIGRTIGSFFEKPHPVSKGYSPFSGVITQEPIKIETHKGDVDSVKIKYLKKLIEDSKDSGISLVFAVSPWYKCPSDEELDLIKSICSQYEVPFISHLRDGRIYTNKALFTDQAHLNDRGARYYSSIIASEIKKITSDAQKN